MSLKAKVQLDYTLDGEDKQVVAEYSAVDLRAWESAHNQSTLVTPMSVSMLTWLGHHAAVRQGMVNGPLTTYKAFDAACWDVTGVNDEEESEVPTRRGGRATPRKASDG